MFIKANVCDCPKRTHRFVFRFIAGPCGTPLWGGGETSRWKLSDCLLFPDTVEFVQVHKLPTSPKHWNELPVTPKLGSRLLNGWPPHSCYFVSFQLPKLIAGESFISYSYFSLCVECSVLTENYLAVEFPYFRVILVLTASSFLTTTFP